jgi:hypothetical protein
MKRRFLLAFLLSCALATLSAFQPSGNSNNFGGMRLLGKSCLAANGNTFDTPVANSTESGELTIETEIPNYIGGADTLGWRFNKDTGNNYRYAWQTRAIAGTTADCANQATSTDRIKLGCADATTGRIVTGHVSNVSGKFHIVRLEGQTDTGSVASQPNFDNGTGGYSQTGFITTVTTFTSTNSMSKGTCTTVYGR